MGVPYQTNYGHWDHAKGRWIGKEEEVRLERAATEPAYRLFVYGGLRPGGPLARTLQSAVSVCDAVYPARHSRMTVLGVEPGLYPDPAGPEILGHLYRVPESLMRAVDHVMAGTRRARVKAVPSEGVTDTRAWCHFPVLAAPDDAVVVAGGDWLGHLKATVGPWLAGLDALRSSRKAAAEEAKANRAAAEEVKKAIPLVQPGTGHERMDRLRDNPWRDHLKFLKSGETSVVITELGRRVTWQKSGKTVHIIKSEPPGQWPPASPPVPEPSVDAGWSETDGDKCAFCGWTIELLDGVGWCDVDSVSVECLNNKAGHSPKKPWYKRTVEDWEIGGSD